MLLGVRHRVHRWLACITSVASLLTVGTVHHILLLCGILFVIVACARSSCMILAVISYDVGVAKEFRVVGPIACYTVLWWSAALLVLIL